MKSSERLFSIELGNVDLESYGEVCAKGKLTINDFTESFDIPLSYWSRAQYRRQWREAVEMVCLAGVDSALVTSMRDPASTNFIFWWVLYKVDGKVHVQNEVLFLDELETRFDELDIYSAIGKRTTRGDEGERISEWTLKVDQMQRWLGAQSTASGD